MNIGGNIQALLQWKKEDTKNSIGERVVTWENGITITGWLDLSTGDSKHTTFSAKVQESTHIFLCDFIDLQISGEQGVVDLSSDNVRMIVDGNVYEILLIDNPMGMNNHLEFYLRFIGGEQNAS